MPVQSNALTAIPAVVAQQVAPQINTTPNLQLQKQASQNQTSTRRDRINQPWMVKLFPVTAFSPAHNTVTGFALDSALINTYKGLIGSKYQQLQFTTLFGSALGQLTIPQYGLYEFKVKATFNTGGVPVSGGWLTFSLFVRVNGANALEFDTVPGGAGAQNFAGAYLNDIVFLNPGDLISFTIYQANSAALALPIFNNRPDVTSVTVRYLGLT